MMLTGNLSDWSVGDLLQMLHITKKTASLHIEGSDRSGVVYFEDGAIVNAEVSLGGGPKSEPRDEVVEAVYVLELLDAGAFEIKNEVPPRMVEPLAVAEALELAGQHLDAERRLEQTGLLAARGLRLAQLIEEPIMLSEQVWNAISVSIPAFTFPELEARLGRAAAISTVEQFRDLGILEAVLEEALDEVEPARVAKHEPLMPAENGFDHRFDGSEDQIDSELADAFAGAWTPPAPEPAGEAWTPPAPEPAAEAWTPPAGEMWTPPAVAAESVAWTAPESVVEHAGDHDVDDVVEQVEEIVPHTPEAIRPIVSDAPDDSIVVADEQPVDRPAERPSEPVSPGLTPGATSLSAAIRAAAGASAASRSDDEAQLLSEAAGDAPARIDEAERSDAGGPAVDDGSLRRTVKSLASPPSGASEGGALGDLSARFRQAVAADQED